MPDTGQRRERTMRDRGAPISETLATAKRPWYVVPNGTDSGVSAVILNCEGEHVATVEDMGEARAIAQLINDARA